MMRKELRSWFAVAAVTAVIVLLGMRTVRTTTQAQEKQVRTQRLMWSQINAVGAPGPLLKVFRAHVPGGWLVLVHQRLEKGQSHQSPEGYGYGVGVGSGVTFVPDPEHKWRVQ